MKQANKNPVDLLLRSLARGGQDESWPGDEAAFRAAHPDGSAVANHLDADELSLYAEGVLSGPARARYGAHLADCGSCRGIVARLAQAAGTGAQTQIAKQQSGAGVWKILAAIFSPRVLGFALPALVLTAVVGMGLFALREQNSPAPDLVARNQQGEYAAPRNEPNPSDSPGSVATGAPTIPGKKSEPAANTDSGELKNNSTGAKGSLAETPDTNVDGRQAPGSGVKDVSESPQARGAPAAVFAPEPAPPPPKVGLLEADDKAIARKEQPAEREAAKRNQDEYKLLSKDDSPTHGPARSRSSSAGSRRDVDLATEKSASSGKDKQEADKEVETRAVSGRRFRRQGNAWIDTAYESSRGATNVARGSEQFRALLADEPGLRAIVQQLGGEVVVVWKNRAYRIR